MSDRFAHSRLPDLPTAGYATRQQKELTDAIMFLCRGLERDRLLLLETVIKGRTLWRKRFISAFRAIKADAEFADAVFGYLVLLAGPNPHDQKARLELANTQGAESQWDKRLRTLLRQAKDRKGLEMDIVRESLKARKTYSH
jgi:hypothetical protein